METPKPGFYYNATFGFSDLMYRCNENFKNLINYDRQLSQTFTFPYFIIEYICINCKTKVSQKLMKLCKYLRSLQVQIGFAHIDYFVADQQHRSFSCDVIIDIQIVRFGTLYRFHIPDFYRIRTDFKAIKVNQYLEISCPRKDKIDEFLFSLNLTNLEMINVCNSGLSLLPHVVNHLLSSSLEDIEVYQFPNYLLKSAFLKLKHLNALRFFPSEEITLETFKTLINTKRSKLDVCEISRLSLDIKAEEICQFLDAHMTTEYGWLHLSYGHSEKMLSEEAEIFKSEIQTRMNARKEMKIPTCKIILDVFRQRFEFFRI